MQRRKVLAGVALAAALVFPLAGCSSGGKVRLNMAKMCQSHGGVWVSAGETCSMSAAGASAAAKQAKDICTENGGSYLPGGTCEIEGGM
jgi:ABC-type transport system involved in cytochrome c biogenesis ATPase subunit